MAKKNNAGKGGKSKRIINIDLSNVEARMLVPEGDYKVKIQEVTSEVGEDSGKPYLQFVMEIISGEYAGQTLYHKCSLQPQALFNLKNTLLAAGVSVPQKAMNLDLDELINKELGIAVGHETYDGKKKARILDVFPLSGDEDDGDDDDSDEEEDDEVDLDEMDLAELKAFAKENEIDLSELSKNDKKKADKVRAFIKENMPEDDDEDEEDEEEDEDEAPDYSEMEEDELKKLCKEREIKVSKKDKKKDLIKKLEEADAAEDDEDDEV